MAANFKDHLLMKRTLFHFIILFSLFINSSKAAKLTVPRILLPYNTGVPTNYTLEVKEGGCYKWSSNRYDLVSVTPLPSERERVTCTTKALVSAVSRYPERDNAVILAEDEKSGQVLRCDVVIDSLHSIEIVTTTRVLYLEDAPEVFEVMAKNDQGDTFSNLAGVAFHWSLESDSYATDAYGVLRFLKFADSVYKTPPNVNYWENQNMHGSMILIEGSKTGSAKVTVKPMDPAYKYVNPYEVSLVIVANLMLKPAHIFLLPSTKVKYNLELIKQGKAFPIGLPSDQYYLEIADSDIAVLDTEASTATALIYGSTNIVAKDRYITGKEIAYLPSAVIHVTIPSYLTLSVSPGDKWSLEEKKIYFVSTQVYDRNGQPIHITQDVRVVIQFPSKYFSVKMKSTNGTYQEVQALAPGICKITAQLIGVATKDGIIKKIEPVVSASQDVIIYKSITVLPAFTLLPWDPVTNPTYSILLKASGGTGVFNWKCGDSSLASVYAVYENDEQKGRVTTFGRGTFQIQATDAHLPLFTGSAKVSIQPIVDMQILPKEVEVEVNGSLVLPVAMYGYLPDKTAKMFSNCTEVPIIVDIDEIQKFTYFIDENLSVFPSACRNVLLKCHSKGFNRIHIKYENEDTSLKKTTVIGCYKKLKVLHPSNEAVIAIGSSMGIIFQGGPNAWPRCNTYFVNSSPEYGYVDISVVQNRSDSATDIHKVHAFCKGYGQEAFLLTVGNRPCESNKHPVINEVSYKIFCSLPESITLRPVLPTVDGKKCPASGENLIAIHSSQHLQIELIVKDSAGREFHNISSLDIKWYLSDYSLAYFAYNEGAKPKFVPIPNGHYRTKYFQQLHPYGPEGSLKVTASIAGYKSSFVKELEFVDEKFLPSINSSLKFILVEEPVVEPKKVSVFNSPSNKVYLNISKGSGYFEVETSNSNKVKVVYMSSSGQIEITPLETGTLTISIIDLCLGIKHESVAEVQIYGISAVVVDVLDKIQLGHSISATVEILNEENQNIPASMFSLMNLQPVSVSDIISMQLSSPPEPHQFQASYKITGLLLGHTTFKVVTNANLFKSIQYSSQAYPIQVFSPLRLSPDHIVLVVGATFQILYSGGPQPQTNIEFTMDDKEIAVVSVAGVVEAKKVGKTTLYARSIGHNKNGNTIVFSEDKALVSCISLKEIKIHSPLSRMVAQTEMPLYVMGITELESPFTFGTALPTAKFKWTVSNDKVASLHNLYSSVGLQEANENNFRVGLRAHQDGLVTVHVEVTMPKESSVTFFGSQQVLSSDIQIQVFKKLKLTNPNVEGDIILLSPNSLLKLKCNRFGPAKVTFRILPPANRMSHAPVASVDKEGNLIASSKIGSEVLLVTAVEDFDVVQELSVIVKVEEIAYMMVRPIESIQTREWPLSTLPVGFTISFSVTYHDNIGLQFDAVRSQLKFRTSRHNLARVSFGSTNTTLTAQVVKSGYTVLKLETNYPATDIRKVSKETSFHATDIRKVSKETSFHAALFTVWDVQASVPPDYIRIVTGDAIDPSDVQLTVGDVICFGSPLLTKEGHGGTWMSLKPILSIHPVSGGAVALSPGITTVTYSLLNGYSTSTEVTIQDVAYISVVPGSVHHISNFPRSKPYKIPIVIQSNDTHRSNNLIGRNCSYATESSMPLPLVQPPFTCELNFISNLADISIGDIFLSTSGFDMEKGMYFCNIEPVNKIPLSETSALDGQLSLSVHLFSMDHSSSLSQQHLLTFLPAFHVQQTEVVFSDYQFSAQVIITAAPAVQRCIMVIPSDQSILQVQSPVLNPLYPGAISFVVEVQSRSDLWRAEHIPLQIDISCPLTKQQVQLPVKVKRLENSLDGSQYCAPPSLAPIEPKYDWHFWLPVFTAVFICFMCLYVFRWLTSSRRGVVTTQPVFLNRSNGSHGFSPAYSPYSPQSFSPRYTPPANVDDLSGPLRLCTLDTSPKTIRRRSDNIFR